MTRDSQNVLPVTMALVLHVMVFGSLIFAFDFRDRTMPVVPMALTATLVTDNAIVVPPKVEEPPPPEPDTSEQDRIRAEQEKRAEDARLEQERLSRIRKAEEEAAAERQRQAEAEQRRKDEETRKERERQEAERRRQEEIERQRQENERERLRLEGEAEAARQAELEAESNRLQAMQADAKAAYMFAIQRRVMNSWVAPASAVPGIECVANIRQAPGGQVISVALGRCNGDAAVERSIVAAINRASPLPMPSDPSLFEREVRITFRPEDQN